jgi:hypothetical protein
MGTRPRAPHSRAWLASVVTLALCTCDDPSDTGSADGVWLHGRITDASGVPVAGAPVGLAYRLGGLPDECNPESHAPKIAPLVLDLPNPGFVDLHVVDYLQRMVRTLLHGEWAPGPRPVVWDGLDDAGRRVPAGMYFMRLRVSSPDRQWQEERRTFMYFCSRQENLQAPHAMTDANGEYRIEMGLLPIGERFEAADDTGLRYEVVVDTNLHVQAGVNDGVSWRSASVPASVAVRSHDLRVDLVLP